MSHVADPGPLCTRESLSQDLTQLGLKEGDAVIVHSSVNKIGWVNGGPETVIRALLDVLGPSGTLVVPTHSIDNTDPSTWTGPDYKPVPESWWQTIRDTMPAYDPLTTRSRRMGLVPETVRTWPGAKRSGHPQTSFTAIGGNAERVTADHPLDCRMGEKSPLAKLEALDAKILLIGVDFEKCTAFHLAEYRAASTPTIPCSFAVTVDGNRRWMTVQDRKWGGEDFATIGTELCKEFDSPVIQGSVGKAHCYLTPLPKALEYATQWLKNHKEALP